jgi:hypothetical protein
MYTPAMNQNQWVIKGHHKGTFDQFGILGIRYENVDGETGWDITPWRNGLSPTHSYWVAGGNFFSVTMHKFYKNTPENRIEIFHPPITDQIDADERAAVLKAITEWESETGDA